jgi:hypothetical protein
MMASRRSAHTKPLITTSLFWLLMIITICAATVTARRDADTEMRKRHHMWAVKHGRTYKDPADQERRYKVFQANAEFIDSFNAGAKKNKREPRAAGHQQVQRQDGRGD